MKVVINIDYDTNLKIEIVKCYLDFININYTIEENCGCFSGEVKFKLNNVEYYPLNRIFDLPRHDNILINAVIEAKDNLRAKDIRFVGGDIVEIPDVTRYKIKCDEDIPWDELIEEVHRTWNSSGEVYFL